MRVRRLVRAAVAAPSTGLGTWLRPLALKRVTLLPEPFLLDQVGPHLMEVVAIREVDLLLNGLHRELERTVPEAPTAPAIELTVLSGYDGQRLAYLLVRQVRNFFGGAQDVAPFQVVTIQSFPRWIPNQEYTVQPHDCFYNRDEVAGYCIGAE